MITYFRQNCVRSTFRFLVSVTEIHGPNLCHMQQRWWQ